MVWIKAKRENFCFCCGCFRGIAAFSGAKYWLWRSGSWSEVATSTATVNWRQQFIIVSLLVLTLNLCADKAASYLSLCFILCIRRRCASLRLINAASCCRLPGNLCVCSSMSTVAKVWSQKSQKQLCQKLKEISILRYQYWYRENCPPGYLVGSKLERDDETALQTIRYNFIWYI